MSLYPENLNDYLVVLAQRLSFYAWDGELAAIR